MAEWYKVAPILAEGHRLIMVDHRSHGLTMADRGRFEIADEADDLADILRQLDVRPVALVGYSMGGAIVQAATFRHPELVRSMVLVATMSHHPRWWKAARIAGALIASLGAPHGHRDARGAHGLPVGSWSCRAGTWAVALGRNPSSRPRCRR